MKHYHSQRFAQMTGLSIKALRLYEQKGLLVPKARSDNGYRLYEADQVAVGKRIRRLRAIGFRLEEIRPLLHLDRRSSEELLAGMRSSLTANMRAEENLHRQRKILRWLIGSLKRKASDRAPETVLQARVLYRKSLSDSILCLDRVEILARTKAISNEDYLRTLAMVSDSARAHILSVLSPRALALVQADLQDLRRKYAEYW